MSNVILILNRVLLDTSNLFVSQDPSKLVNCCEAIKSLIYPFKYEVIYVPHLPKAFFEILEVPAVFMLGVEDKLYEEASALVKDDAWVIELDRNDVHQNAPAGAARLGRVGRDEDPELPNHMQKRLADKLGRIVKNAKPAGRLLDEREVKRVRECFFELFVDLLRHYHEGVKQSQFQQEGEDSSLVYDPSYLFHFEAFLAQYEQTDEEAHTFLRTFCYMPMFQRLIQREALHEDQHELGVFKKALRRNASSKEVALQCLSSGEDAHPVAKEEYHCHPFFDLMIEARDCSELGTAGQPKKEAAGKRAPDESKQAFLCLKYRYRSTPQCLDVGLMTKRFVKTLLKGEKLKEFDKFCRVNLEEAKEHRKERKKVERKHRLQAKLDQKSFKSNIYHCWLLAWSSAFRYHMPKEQLLVTQQAVVVLTKMFGFDRDVTDQMEVMMHAAFEHGTERTVRLFFELYFDVFKLPTNCTVHQYMISALKKSRNPEAYEKSACLDYHRQSDPIRRTLMRQTSTARGTPGRQRMPSVKKGLNPVRRSHDSSDWVADAQAARVEDEQSFSFSFDFEMREQALQAESQYETAMEIDHQYQNAFHLVRANKVQQPARDGKVTISSKVNAVGCPGAFAAEVARRAQEYTLGARAVHKLEKRALEAVDKLAQGVADVGEAMVSAGMPDQQVRGKVAHQLLVAVYCALSCRQRRKRQSQAQHLPDGLGSSSGPELQAGAEDGDAQQQRQGRQPQSLQTGAGQRAAGPAAEPREHDGLPAARSLQAVPAAGRRATGHAAG